MLPTNEKATLKSDLAINENNLLFQPSKLEGTWFFLNKYQHLYVLSDEKPEIGDWLLTPAGIFKVQKNNQYWGGKKFCDIQPWHKKIIATTDNSLVMKSDIVGGFKTDLCFPQIPQSFVEYFIKEYNKGNSITNVMVEHEEYAVGNYGMSDGEPTIDERLKINPKDNTITIQKVKNNYNREEIEYLLHLIVNESHCGFDRVKQPNSNECADFVNKWISRNL